MSWVIDQQEVHITIGSSIQLESNFPDLHSAMRMVRAALLYADQSKLVSVSSFALLDLGTPRDIDDLDPEAFLRNQILWSTGEDKNEVEEMLEIYQRAKRRRHSKRGRQALMLFKSEFAKYLKDRQKSAASLISKAGADGIVEVVQSGLLQIHQFESIFESITQRNYNPEKIVVDYISAVSAAVEDACTLPVIR